MEVEDAQSDKSAVLVGLNDLAGVFQWNVVIGGANLVVATIDVGPLSKVWMSALSRCRRGEWDFETPVGTPVLTIKLSVEDEPEPVIAALGPTNQGFCCIKEVKRKTPHSCVIAHKTHDPHAPSHIGVDFFVDSSTVLPTRIRPIPGRIYSCTLVETIAFCSGHTIVKFRSSWTSDTYNGAFALRTATYFSGGSHSIVVERRVAACSAETSEKSASVFVSTLNQVLDCGCATAPLSFPVLFTSPARDGYTKAATDCVIESPPLGVSKPVLCSPARHTGDTSQPTEHDERHCSRNVYEERAPSYDIANADHRASGRKWKRDGAVEPRGQRAVSRRLH